MSLCPTVHVRRATADSQGAGWALVRWFGTTAVRTVWGWAGRVWSAATPQLRRWGGSNLPTAPPPLHLTLLTPLVKGGTHRGKYALIPQDYPVGQSLQEEGMTIRKHALPL